MALSQIDRYVIVRKLGAGSMGVVYQAEDPRIERSVALKTFHIENPLFQHDKEEYVKRFLQEAQAAGQLAHPNIVTIYDVGEDETQGLSYIAMEYVEGSTLEEVMREQAVLDSSESLTIIQSVAEALDYAHAQGIIHRDIKPANILLTDNNVSKITDFGIARISSSNLTQTGEFLGTPYYMAPEQVIGEEISGATDRFALGILAYELFSGQRPFSGEHLSTLIYKIAHERHPKISRQNQNLSPHLDRLFDKALAKEPAKRYRSGTAFANDLTETLEAPQPPSAPKKHWSSDFFKIPTLPISGDWKTWVSFFEEQFKGWVRFFEERVLAASLLAFTSLFLSLALLAALVQPGGSPFSLLTWGTEPAIHFVFEHTLPEGRLAIYVDNHRVYSSRFYGEQSDTTGGFFRRLFQDDRSVTQGRFSVPPGNHKLRVAIESQQVSFESSGSIRGQFASGERHNLLIRLAGINNTLKLIWQGKTSGEG